MAKQTANSTLLPKASTPVTWRLIEAALQDYFGGVNHGDIIATLEGEEFLECCDDCEVHNPPLFELNLTALAKHIADQLGAAHG